jgi:DNA-binding transcriptional LysR family regulator
MTMNIEQIEAFIYVSLTGSFSKAGEILYISQPSVSARIKALEKEMGFQLFKRSGKNIMLTKEGETFLPYAKVAMENMQDGMLAVQQKNSKTQGELNIATVLTISNYVLPNLIKGFHQAYPNIKLVIHTGHSHNILDMVLNHEVPIGIARSVSHPHIESTHLIDDEMVLAIYPDHHYSTKKTITVNEVAKEPLILFNRGSFDWTLINNAFKGVGVNPNVVLEVDNIELAKHMVKKEMGIGILPRFSIEEELRSNTLNEVTISNLPQLSRPFQIIHLKETKIEGILKIFYNFLFNQLSQVEQSKK